MTKGKEKNTSFDNKGVLLIKTRIKNVQKKYHYFPNKALVDKSLVIKGNSSKISNPTPAGRYNWVGKGGRPTALLALWFIEEEIRIVERGNQDARLDTNFVLLDERETHGDLVTKHIAVVELRQRIETTVK